MGWRIRKSFGVGPFRATLSKGGVSTSVGVKGARITSGPRGTRITTGLGGFSYSERIDTPNGGEVRHASTTSGIPPIQVQREGCARSFAIASTVIAVLIAGLMALAYLGSGKSSAADAPAETTARPVTATSVSPPQSTYYAAPTITNPDKIQDRPSEIQAAEEFQKAKVARRQIPIDEMPRGSLAAQVYLDAASMTYYREDCVKPAAAERRKMPKAMAIKEGYRPAPDCNTTK